MHQELLTPCILGTAYRGSLHPTLTQTPRARTAHLVFTTGTSARYSRLFILSNLRFVIDEYTTKTKGLLVLREDLYSLIDQEQTFIGYAQSPGEISVPPGKAVEIIHSDYLTQVVPTQLILVKNFSNFL